MIRLHRTALAVTLLWFTLSASSLAHNGRRFAVSIEDNQYVAQGSNTGAPDGLDSVRPYDNSLHDHWRNVLTNVSTAILPGFDVPGDTRLAGIDLQLTLLDVYKWELPPLMPADGTVPDFVPLSGDEDFNISFNGQRILNERQPDGTFGTLTLVDDTPIIGATDLDPLYSISPTPSNVIHVFELQVSDSDDFMMPSEPIYAVLAPDGSYACRTTAPCVALPRAIPWRAAGCIPDWRPELRWRR